MEKNNNTLLLACFIEKQELEKTLKIIKTKFDIFGDKLFVLSDKNNNDKLIITFNIVNKSIKFNKDISNIINLHRKKETKTLYTVNGLNAAIIEETGKSPADHTYKLNWEKYKDCILIEKNGELTKIETKLESIESVIPHE